jgi:hypothetical protein
MVGKNPDNASPVVMFLSKDRAIREKAQRKIKESGILDHYPAGIKTGHDATPARQLAAGVLDHHPTSMGDVESHMTIQITGNKIFVPGSGQGNPSIHRATFGGLVRHNGNVYIFTAHHPFHETGVAPSSTEASAVDEGWVIDDDSDPETEPDTDPYAEAALFAFSSNTSPTLPYQPNIEESPDNAVCSNETSELDNLGYKIRIVSDKEGLTYDTRIFGSPALDYALISANNSDALSSIAQSCNERSSMTSCQTHVITTGPSDCTVMTYTASGGSMDGILSGTPLYMRLPGGNTFLEVYVVHFNGPLAQGDCGSWVLDKETKGLYGHIVAGCELEGIAYIMPALDVFKDVEVRLGRNFLLEFSISLEAVVPSHFQMPASTMGNLSSKTMASYGPELDGTLLPHSDNEIENEATQHRYQEHNHSQNQAGDEGWSSEGQTSVVPSALDGFGSTTFVRRSNNPTTQSHATTKISQVLPAAQPQASTLIASNADQWPAVFTQRRKIDLTLENRPYIEAASIFGSSGDILEKFMQDPQECDLSDAIRVGRVRNFCGPIDLATFKDQKTDATAWLDERSLDGHQAQEQNSTGPLTAADLHAALRKPV